MECLLLEEGGNRYKLPHMAKSKLRKTVEDMPLTIQCRQTELDKAMAKLRGLPWIPYYDMLWFVDYVFVDHVYSKLIIVLMFINIILFNL